MLIVKKKERRSYNSMLLMEQLDSKVESISDGTLNETCVKLI